MDPQNYIQYTTGTPWAFDSFNSLQDKNFFEITLEMQEVIDQELYTYLTEILELLCEEKLSATNEIDSLVASTSSSSRCDKQCPNCGERNIENRKQICPKCKARLPALSELPKQDISEVEKGVKEQSIIFKPHFVEKETKTSAVPRISVTQKSSVDQGVNIPEIFVPDPLNINPNSTVNIEKVLSHIEKISGIIDGRRKWVAVTCDGVPYHRIIKIKEKYPWLVLIPGQLHEEMNMLRAYVELNW